MHRSWCRKSVRHFSSARLDVHTLPHQTIHATTFPYLVDGTDNSSVPHTFNDARITCRGHVLRKNASGICCKNDVSDSPTPGTSPLFAHRTLDFPHKKMIIQQKEQLQRLIGSVRLSETSFSRTLQAFDLQNPVQLTGKPTTAAPRRPATNKKRSA